MSPLMPINCLIHGWKMPLVPPWHLHPNLSFSSISSSPGHHQSFHPPWHRPQPRPKPIPPTRCSQPQMLVSKARHNTPSWSTRNEAKLQQVWLVHILNCLRIFAGAGGQRIQPDRATIELLDDRQQQVAIGLIETDMVNLQRIQGRLSYFPRNHAVGSYLRIVTHALEQAVHDTRRATGASGNFINALFVGWYFEDTRRADQNQFQRRWIIVLMR